MCNCNRNSTSVCGPCSKGMMCQCPPDYNIAALPVDCGCCPSGYVWSGPTANYPNGLCTGPGGTITEPIECSPCEDSLDARCVILPSVPCFGITAGTTLYYFITNYMCSDAFWLNGLLKIGASTTLQSAFCNIVSTCPTVPGSTTPVSGPLTGTLP